MKLGGYTWQELFDPDNRMRALMVKRYRGRAFSTDGLLITVGVIGIPALAILWGITLWGTLHGSVGATLDRFIQSSSQVSYALLVIVAFLAPSAGSAIRSKIDRSPLLFETLTTPQPIRRMCSAMYGRLVLMALLSIGLYLVVASSVYTMFHTGNPAYLSTMKRSGLEFLILVLEPERVPMPLSGLGLLVSALAILLSSLNYAAGVYLRGTVLVNITHLSAHVRVYGSVYTIVLLASALISFALRVMLIGILVNNFFGRSGLQLAAVLVVEVPVFVTRLVLCAKIWDRLPKRLENDFQEYLLEQRV